MWIGLIIRYACVFEIESDYAEIPGDEDKCHCDNMLKKDSEKAYSSSPFILPTSLPEIEITSDRYPMSLDRRGIEKHAYI